jgi:hypothetical protein|tara:strand:- start:4568 stop:4702 length:135 start_codon:yes stop_codon:yes gene_type:complete
MKEREPWESPLDDEEWAPVQEPGDIDFEKEEVMKLKFSDYKGNP